MSFVRQTKFETRFRGEQVTCELDPLLTEDLLEVQDAPDPARGAIRVAPKYVRNLVGAQVEDVFRYAWYFPLALEISTALVNAARPPDPSMPVAASAGSRLASGSAPTSGEASAGVATSPGGTSTDFVAAAAPSSGRAAATS